MSRRSSLKLPRHTTKIKLTGLTAALFASALVLSACGSVDVDSSATSAEDAPSEINPDIIDNVVRGTFTEPEGEPLQAETGKQVWVMSCGQATIACSSLSDSAVQAAEAIGWNVRLFDGKTDPSAFVNGVRQAIAAKADGIIMASYDCALVKEAVNEAISTGIEVVAMASVDCSDPGGGGGPSLYKDRQPVYPGFDGFGEYLFAWAEARAEWIIAEKEGKVNAIVPYNTEFPFFVVEDQGTMAALDRCKTCNVERVAFLATDFGPPLQQIIQQAILKMPNANVLFSPDDGTITNGIAAAVNAAGAKDDITVIGGEGFAPNMGIIADDAGQDAALAWGGDWIGWAAVDTLNSVYQGENPRSSGLGWQLITREHNLPPAGQGYEPPIDFRAVYKKLWGF